MKVKVFDTWVDDSKIHFDVLLEDVGGGKKQHATDMTKAIESAKAFLTSIGKPNLKVTADECAFCHVETATPVIEAAIKKDGYYIYKMKGC